LNSEVKQNRAKKNFVNSLKAKEVKGDTEGGGDYWVICLSAISNGCKLNKLQPIIDKRVELEEKYGKNRIQKNQGYV
jgi:hypothetical protein